MTIRAILLIAIIASFFTERVRAEAASNLPGSGLKLENAVLKADVIFVGKIIQIGGPTAAGTFDAEFCGNQVKVLQNLRGSATTPVRVAFTVVGKEQVPSAGGTYLFFVNKVSHPDPDPLTAIKILSATKNNIAKVKKLILQRPKN